MKRLWNVINEMKIKKEIKNKLYLGVLIAINIVKIMLFDYTAFGTFLGAGLWLLIGRIFLPGTEWLICFMGYPAIFIGFFGGILYLYNHEFA